MFNLQAVLTASEGDSSTLIEVINLGDNNDRSKDSEGKKSLLGGGLTPAFNSPTDMIGALVEKNDYTSTGVQISSISEKVTVPSEKHKEPVLMNLFLEDDRQLADKKKQKAEKKSAKDMAISQMLKERSKKYVYIF